ncbi:hypothetical protein HPB48_015932 [Haemaphysalis longicornis]|uniref:Uncharacterized protein n=1 Tax=Haemaphysalis longicornis TaxID=44386 RepID=A0A9J6GBN6_HAELO|nr:hypothetical protein HPB48_015932 [Haemaphysalis longicornis]
MQFHTARIPRVVLFLLSTLLGRSPAVAQQGQSTAASKIMLGTWMVGVFFVGQFIQTDITAARTVPPFSSPIGSLDRLNELLDARKIKPCMNSMMSSTIRKVAHTLDHLKSLSQAVDACNKSCIGHCIRKAHEEPHAIVGKCPSSITSGRQFNHLAVGEDTLFTELRVSAAHGRFPLR